MDRFQFITHCNGRYDEITGACAAIAGGCRWVQLRMKHAQSDQIVSVGQKLSHICRSAGAMFIIDDHVELVDQVCADGVHLGKKDMPVSDARKILGPGKIIGATANVFEDVKTAVMAGADYVGLGPFRFTTTKTNLSPVLGIDGYRRIIDRCRQENIDIPIVAIGGVEAKDIPALSSTGICGVAVSGAILCSDDPIMETSRIIELLNKHIVK